jgi:uncharacterized protein (TIGR02145 family)
MIELAGTKIANQIWSKSNLNIETFQNGHIIQIANNEDDCLNASNNRLPICCYYDYIQENDLNHGRLYNGYAFADPRGLAPHGWYIPTSTEWEQLIDYLVDNAGIKIRKSKNWLDGLRNSDKFNFNALPSGCCNNEGVGYDLNTWACWWSSSEVDESNSIAFIISIEFDEIGFVADDKGFGLSVSGI